MLETTIEKLEAKLREAVKGRVDFSKSGTIIEGVEAYYLGDLIIRNIRKSEGVREVTVEYKDLEVKVTNIDQIGMQKFYQEVRGEFKSVMQRWLDNHMKTQEEIAKPYEELKREFGK